MGQLRCKTPHMVHREIGAYMPGYNRVRSVMAQAAAAARCEPVRLSFKGTLAVLRAFQESLRHAGKQTKAMWHRVLGAIATAKLRSRPGRIEPRAVKRRPKPCPRLMEPRQVARLRLAAA